MLQEWTMKLIELTNICCISDRVVCTINKKIDGMLWFPANVYVVNGLQSENKRPIN